MVLEITILLPMPGLFKALQQYYSYCVTREKTLHLGK